MTNNPSELLNKANVTAGTFKDNGNSNVTDPWGHVSGQRFENKNPWIGKYDRRKKSRPVENDIDFSLS